MGFLSEQAGGKTSWMRAIGAVVAVVPVLSVTGVWTWLSIEKGEFQPIPASMVTLLGGLLSIVFGGKLLQKHQELRAAVGEVISRTKTRRHEAASPFEEVPADREVRLQNFDPARASHP